MASRGRPELAAMHPATRRATRPLSRLESAGRTRWSAEQTSFFLTNLGWSLEEVSTAEDRHHWAVRFRYRSPARFLPGGSGGGGPACAGCGADDGIGHTANCLAHGCDLANERFGLRIRLEGPVDGLHGRSQPRQVGRGRRDDLAD
jgi:hypothetical protein